MIEPRLLGGRYELGELLGYGGMAEVHRGKDTRLGRDVAVKILRPDLARDPGFQTRFRREAQAAAALNHPSIVAVYDTGEDVGAGRPLPYIVMEYVAGRTLRDALSTEHRLLPERAMEITAEMCRALDYSHRHGIIHRDVKPANVMLTPAGDVKVMDFGIARAISESSNITQTAQVIGTAQYLSPEQARGETVDARSDVYAVGCVLYELLTGAPPFTGESPVSVAYQHVREDAVPPSRINPDVTPTVDAIVLKAMAKNPANRYQSAADMRSDILRSLAGQAVQATPLLAAPTARIAGTAVPTAGATQVLPPEPRRSGAGRALAYLLLALIAIAVLVGAAFLTKNLLGRNSSTVSMPKVVGDQYAAAEAALRAKGFTTISRRNVPSDKPVNEVVSQDPTAGAKAAKTDAVTLTASAGPAPVAVPSVVGQPLVAAEDILHANGFAVGATTSKDSPQPRNTVLDYTPKGLAPRGSRIQLVYASGLNTVPGVIGSSQAAAQDALRKAGFTYNTSLQQSSSAPPGSVLQQTPASGKLAVGSPVTLVIAAAPPPSPTTSSPSPTPSATTASPTPSPTPTRTRSPKATGTPTLAASSSSGSPSGTASSSKSGGQGVLT